MRLRFLNLGKVFTTKDFKLTKKEEDELDGYAAEEIFLAPLVALVVQNSSAIWMVGPLGVPDELVRIEVDLAQSPRGIAFNLVVEVFVAGVAAFAAGGDGDGADAGPELDHGYETVAGMVP